MTEPTSRPPPLALAIEWVAKITTVALEMVLPAIVGNYFDQQWGARYWTIVGLVVGMTVGLWHLLKMTALRKSGSNKTGSTKPGKRD